MLYNKNWDAKTVTSDPFALESLIAWLEKQPADREYDYCQPGTCLTAQYLKAQGIIEFVLDIADLDRLGWHEIAQHAKYEDHQEWTFGAALTRARAALAA